MSVIITKESIDVFIGFLRENEKSQSTIEKYVCTIRKLEKWMGGRAITKSLLIDYRGYLYSKGCSVSTINGSLSAINAYLGISGLNECRVKFLKRQKSAFRPSEKELTRDEYISLVETAREKGDERLALVMETICSSGIRVSELQYITVEAAARGRADIALKGKIRTILLPHSLCRKLLCYAEMRDITSGEIFLSRRGSSISRKLIWAEMKALCGPAGVEPSKVFPHNLRHLFARCFYQSSNDVVKLADVLGHSSIETTRIYLMSTGEEHAKTIDSLSLVL